MEHTVSLVLLTFNRKDITTECVLHNIRTAGYPIAQIVWVDNGSDDGIQDFMPSINPDVSVLHKTNTGVARGYNSGYKMVTSELIVHPGTDLLLPDNWLKIMVESHTSLKNPGSGSIIHGSIKEPFFSERILGSQINAGKHMVIPARSMGSHIFSTELLEKVGYLPYLNSLYGCDDNIWEARIRDNGYLNYIILGYQAKHIGGEHEDPQYRAFKDAEIKKAYEFSRSVSK